MNFEIDVAKYSIKTVTDSINELNGNNVNQTPKDESKAISEQASELEDKGPKYFINTKIEEKAEVKIPLSRESKDKDNDRRFKE